MRCARVWQIWWSLITLNYLHSSSTYGMKTDWTVHGCLMSVPRTIWWWTMPTVKWTVNGWRTPENWLPKDARDCNQWAFADWMGGSVNALADHQAIDGRTIPSSSFEQKRRQSRASKQLISFVILPATCGCCVQIPKKAFTLLISCLFGAAALGFCFTFIFFFFLPIDTRLAIVFATRKINEHRIYLPNK